MESSSAAKGSLATSAIELSTEVVDRVAAGSSDANATGLGCNSLGGNSIRGKLLSDKQSIGTVEFSGAKTVEAV